jgi:hypothetical protein
MSEARVASPFILRMLYDDRMTYNIVETASQVLGKVVQYEVIEQKRCRNKSIYLNNYVKAQVLFIHQTFIVMYE